MNINFHPNATNIRRQKYNLVNFLLLVLFGVAFIAGGVRALSSSQVDAGWPRATGEVVDATSYTHRVGNRTSTTYVPVVAYQVDGQTYQVAGSSSSSSYPHIGEKRTVAYNPAQPNQAKLVESFGDLWFVYIFPTVGILSIALALYLFIGSIKRTADISQLLLTGQKRQGVLTGVKSPNIANNSTYKFVVSATDPGGATRTYVSDRLIGLDGLALTAKTDFHSHPIPINVYIDPTNPKKYYVDITNMPTTTTT